jgi:hypothetical protein
MLFAASPAGAGAGTGFRRGLTDPAPVRGRLTVFDFDFGVDFVFDLVLVDLVLVGFRFVVFRLVVLAT